MVRRGAFVGVLLAGPLGGFVAFVGCSADAPPPVVVATTAAPPPTAPNDAEPGTGVLVLGRESFALEVTACALEPVLDPATNVTTDVSVTATGADGVVVTAVRSTFTAAVPTVTETINYAIEGGGGVLAESERVDAGGRVVDLRDPAATGPLIEVVDGTLLVAEGRFGAPNARGPGSTDLDGTLVLRCP